MAVFELPALNFQSGFVLTGAYVKETACKFAIFL